MKAIRNTAKRVLWSWKHWSHGLKLSGAAVGEYFHSAPPILNLSSTISYLGLTKLYCLIGTSLSDDKPMWH